MSSVTIQQGNEKSFYVYPPSVEHMRTKLKHLPTDHVYFEEHAWGRRSLFTVKVMRGSLTLIVPDGNLVLC